MWLPDFPERKGNGNRGGGGEGWGLPKTIHCALRPKGLYSFSPDSQSFGKEVSSSPSSLTQCAVPGRLPVLPGPRGCGWQKPRVGLASYRSKRKVVHPSFLVFSHLRSPAPLP